MARQEIHFVHDPARIRAAALKLVLWKAARPSFVILIVIMAGLFVAGMAYQNTWLALFPAIVLAAIVLIAKRYINSSPKAFCGAKTRIAVEDEGIHFSGSDRSGTVLWSGFKEIYLLDQMWAIFVKNSEAVTYVPTDKLEQKTIDFALERFRQAKVKMYGERAGKPVAKA